VTGKLAKHIPTHGHQLAWGACALTSGGLTAMILPTGGISGQAPGQSNLYPDVYTIVATSNDPNLPQVVTIATLSDGVSCVSWQVGLPVVDRGKTPYRFLPGVPIMASVASVSPGCSINVSIRGVLSKT